MNKSGFVIVDKGPHAIGLSDKDGREVLSCEYDKILDFDDDGYVRFLKGGIYGTVDFEGKVAIPLSVGLTHLGVFHNGTARAQKNNDKWGLVDVHGNEVCEFCYKQINAHYGNRYKAFLMDNTMGYLSEDGQFASSGKKEKIKPRYERVATYRNDVAPARQWRGGWVFVDRDQNRVNDIEYPSMDPVLRKGVYYVNRGPNLCGMARYDGTPVVDEWFAHPLSFDDDGFSVCDKLCHDKDGKEIKREGGQPLYLYGIISTEGKYLFPMEYTDIFWNDYDKKDCWFAMDDKFCYLLFRDGSRRVYHKSILSHHKSGAYIPPEEVNNYIPEEKFARLRQEDTFFTKFYRAFSQERFFHILLQQAIILHLDHLRMLYRDTDWQANYDFYQPGRLVRAGDFLEATSHLLCPAHKTRFFIISSGEHPLAEFMKDYVAADEFFPYKDYVFFPNSYFVVIATQKQRGVHQIVLLEVPYVAVQLAKANGIEIGQIAKYKACDILASVAEENLEDQLGSHIHGNSLQFDRVEAMRQPVGIDKNQNPVDLSPQDTFPLRIGSDEEAHAYREYDKMISEVSLPWKKENFLTLQNNTLKVVIGDAASVDAVDIRLNASEWTGREEGFDDILASCYEAGLEIARKANFARVAFPAFPTNGGDKSKKEMAQVVVNALRDCLLRGTYKCNIYICCPTIADAKLYKEVLKNTGKSQLIF